MAISKDYIALQNTILSENEGVKMRNIHFYLLGYLLFFVLSGIGLLMHTTPAVASSTAISGTRYVGVKLQAKKMYAVNWGGNRAGVVAYPLATTSAAATTPKIASGRAHAIALKSDGTVWAWGYNDDGQLGDGTTTNRSTPVQISGLSDVTAIAGGWSHTIALKSDGTVWAWGNNEDGRLGDGTTTSSSTPVQVSGLSDVTAIAGGKYHTIALKSDGTVWAWGNNEDGQLGNGATAYKSPTPVQVSGLSDVTAIAGGGYHTIALKSDGTVWAWGNNEDGQLGNGATAYRSPTPVQVSGLSDITAIAGGVYHTIALKSDDTVWAWGYNKYGQLGDGTYTDKSNPVQVSGLSEVTAIAGGGRHTIALKSDGTVWAWGVNEYGQLGDGTFSYPGQVSDINLGTSTIPTPTPTLTPATSPSLTPVESPTPSPAPTSEATPIPTVSPLPTPTPIPSCKPENITADPEHVKVSIGSKSQVAMTITCEDGTPVEGERVAWKIKMGKKNISIKQKSATTNVNGKSVFTITGIKRGKAIVEFKSGDLKFKVKVSVRK